MFIESIPPQKKKTPQYIAIQLFKYCSFVDMEQKRKLVYVLNESQHEMIHTLCIVFSQQHLSVITIGHSNKDLIHFKLI